MTKKVIIIDDSITQLNFLKSYFAKNGWEVYGAQNAKNAFDMIFDFAPDVIITDAIMPVVGGFQLVKTIREHEKISKLPIIVYSVLNESNAKFYIKEELSEYFLRKEDNIDELLKLAEEIYEKYPIDEKYKSEILKIGLEKNIKEIEKIKEEDPIQFEEEKEEIIIPKENEPIFDQEKLEYAFKEKYDFSFSDDKIVCDIFSILFPILKYDLCAICIDTFENDIKKTYFDIKNIILSPIFQNKILNKYQSSDSMLLKKYAPNLKMIINEEEFYSFFEFNFTYKEKDTARISFYSQEKEKWENYENIEILKSILKSFFKARYINKGKSSSAINKYTLNKHEFNPLEKIDSMKNSYVGIMQIINFSDLKTRLNLEEIDTLNSKISEKIISLIEKNEQIYKNDEDEYNIVIFAKDNKQALYRYNCIANIIEGIFWQEYNLEAIIGVSNCKVDDSFNIYEAQKIAREALEHATSQEKVVIK